MHQIRVNVVDCGRKYLQMRYTDAKGSVHQRSTKETSRRAAERKAALWEKDLAANQHAIDGRMLWKAFRQKYESEACPGMAQKSANRCRTVFNSLEKATSPLRLAEVTPALIREWYAAMRTAGKSENTVSSYGGTLRAALQWAVDCEWLHTVPKFPKLKRAKTGSRAKVMKGRPLTEKEFTAILSVVPKVVQAQPDFSPAGRHPVEQWRFYLRGLWFSGLRLEESIALSWEPGNGFWVDFSGEFPMFRIDADMEKGNQDRILAIAPEFADLLQQIPKADRAGLVFPLPRRHPIWVSKSLTAFGQSADVVVDSKSGKFASAHDLRRSFGDRWARKVMPQVLMELMRHENIETTMRYYVGRNAEATAREIWGLNGKGDGDAGSGSDKAAY